MPDRLQGKIALITGGSSGIGLGIAKTFLQEGAFVAICGRRQETLDKAALELDAGDRLLPIACDVSDNDAVQNMLKAIASRYSHLDILINNAGVRANIRTAEELSLEEWERTFDIDAKGSWLCSKHALPLMRKAGGGSIVMITSISAHIGQAKQGAYNAAKAAQEYLMKCMAIDFAPDNIRCNSICPAWIETEMNRQQLAQMRDNPTKTFPPGFTYEDVIRLHPVGRIGTPQDVAWAAVYLASDESTFVTGSSLMVDGGYTCV